MNNAEKIKHLRKEFKFSQKELANMVGVSQAAVYYWEKNERTSGLHFFVFCFFLF